MTIPNRQLYLLSVFTAFLPLFLTWILLDFGPVGPIWGGLLFNPINLAAYLWFGITVFTCYRARTKSALWLLLGFPIAFAAPAIGALMRYAWTSQHFGH